jgi:hypothetical protein
VVVSESISSLHSVFCTPRAPHRLNIQTIRPSGSFPDGLLSDQIAGARSMSAWGYYARGLTDSRDCLVLWGPA